MRLLLTDRTGNPPPILPHHPVLGISAVTAITSGPFAGDLGAVINQPSTLLRIALP